MPTLSERLESNRLILRKPVIDDGKPIFIAYAADPDIVKYLAWAPHKHVDDTQSFVAERIKEWEKGKRFSWTIIKRGNEDIFGMISARFTTEFRASISYVIASAYWGNGYATEAAIEVKAHLLGLAQVYRVEVFCDVENIASQKVVKKTGMAFEGRLNRTGFAPNLSRTPRDCFCYAITK